MNRAVRLSVIVSSAIATCVGLDASAHAQFVFASSQKTQSVASPQTQVASGQQVQLVNLPQTQLVSVPQTQFVSVPQTQFVSVPQTQLVSVPQTQLVSMPQTQLVAGQQTRLVTATPLFKKHVFANKPFASASSVMTSSTALAGRRYSR